MLSIVEEHYNQGVTWYDLSVKYGVSRSSMKYYAKKYLTTPVPDTPGFIELVRGEAKELVNTGKPAAEPCVPTEGSALEAEVVLPGGTVIKIYSHAGVR